MGRRPGPNHAEINAQDLLVPTPSDLFTQNGEPIKFFIQRDTGKSFVAWLTATIMKYGGTVVPNVPLSGYILIDPLTESGARLKEKWLDPTGRPHRYIVPYTWARASIVARQLLDVEDVKDAKAVFRDAQSPVLMFIHPGIDSVVWRKVRIDIEKYGGITDCTEETARVIIAPHSKKREIVLWNDLVKRYEPDEAKFIEDVEWVERCIQQGQFERTVHRKPNMGGRKPGGSRIEYTKMDDDNLVKYIAEKIPYAESGGRLGNNLYIELENNKEKYPWAQRHSWHSWRNRYKLRQLLFDVAIKAYVKKHANSGSADQDPSASRSPSDEESGEGPEPDAESEDEAGEGVATTSRNTPSKNKPPKKHPKHNPNTAERPGHPALIPLDNAVDSDSSANSDASSTASHPRPSHPKKGKQKQISQKRTARPSTSASTNSRLRKRSRREVDSSDSSDGDSWKGNGGEDENFGGDDLAGNVPGSATTSARRSVRKRKRVLLGSSEGEIDREIVGESEHENPGTSVVVQGEGEGERDNSRAETS